MLFPTTDSTCVHNVDSAPSELVSYNHTSVLLIPAESKSTTSLGVGRSTVKFPSSNVP